MTLVGTGVYMAYIPFNSLLFDRLIATFKHAGNVGFLMYLVDSFGYLGSSMVMVFKQFGGMGEISWLNFYITSILIFLSLSMVLMTGSFIYFQRKLKRQEKAATLELSITNPI
jgi:ABC-type transport system involved in multi-copper enzyme maturation permease subunit